MNHRIALILLIACLLVGCTSAQTGKPTQKKTVAKTATPPAPLPIDSIAKREKSADGDVEDMLPQPLQELQPIGWVSDYVSLFSPTEQGMLADSIAAFEKATTVEIAIVAFDSSYTTRKELDDFVTALGKRWGVGKKETNNGIIIGICPGYKRIRISTGLGMEKRLTDAQVKQIIDNTIVPQYRMGNYFEGTRQGLIAIMAALR
jgi:uncharacterized protein